MILSFLLLDDLDNHTHTHTHTRAGVPCCFKLKLLFGRRLGGRQRPAAYLEKPAVRCGRSRRGWSRGMGKEAGRKLE